MDTSSLVDSAHLMPRFHELAPFFCLMHHTIKAHALIFLRSHSSQPLVLSLHQPCTCSQRLRRGVSGRAGIGRPQQLEEQMGRTLTNLVLQRPRPYSQSTHTQRHKHACHTRPWCPAYMLVCVDGWQGVTALWQSHKYNDLCPLASSKNKRARPDAYVSPFSLTLLPTPQQQAPPSAYEVRE